jgi:hypothetical protein
MKIKLVILFGLIVLVFSSCEKTSNKQNCYTGKMICSTCGGVIIQILDSTDVGETWSNFFVTPIVEYKNCVLAPSIGYSKSNEQSEIYFNFTIVDKLSGGPYCDIGGLPNTKIKITEIFDTKCPD